MRNKEQLLVDICFQIAFVVAENHKWFEKKTKEQISDWVRKQLKENGLEIEILENNQKVLKGKRSKYFKSEYLEKI